MANERDERDGAKSARVLGRREAMVGIGASSLLVAAGCGDEGGPIVAPDETTSPPAANLPEAPLPPAAPPTPADPPPAPPAPPPTPEQLLAGIDHVVVLMMENRSFDHFLGALAQDPGYAQRTVVEGLTGDETNPSPDGEPVSVFKMSNFTPEDPPHGWDKCHAQYNDGANDGFVKAHAGPVQHEVMGFHDRSQIPLYYWFADHFAVCDAWHASVLGPTWPNRFYLHATTSKGKKKNEGFAVAAPRTIWDELADKGVSAKNYAAGVTTWYNGGFVGKLLKRNPSAPIAEFFEAASKGTLPGFSLIDPDYLASDDHPSHNILRGQAFVASVYKALAESPKWSKTLFVITYDEHGGFFDHVAPPETVDDDPEFRRLGFRVPAFVIGPTVKKGYVCKKTLEHVSVAATLRTRFGISNLTPRMSATNDVSDCIDPAKLTAPAPPPIGMPQVVMTTAAALSDGVGTSSQPGLDDLVARGIAPAVDARPDEVRIGAWLEHATRLGAIRLVR